MSDLIRGRKRWEEGWTGGKNETVCGEGSRFKNTVIQREFITKMIGRHHIKSIADVGAGDLNWISRTDLRGCEYTPYDLIVRKKGVIELDITKQAPQYADLVLCLWLLNHFTGKQSDKALENIRKSGAKYLIMTYRPSQQDADLKFIDEVVIRQKKRDSLRLIEL